MRHTGASFLRLFSLLALIGILTALVVALASAAPPASPAMDNIIISEFRTQGESGMYDEFIELFNPSNAPIEIGGWVIRSSSACGNTLMDLATIPSPSILAPGQHYLVAADAASDLEADQIYPASATRSLEDSGGIALVDPSLPIPIDQVGMCATTAYLEGAFLLPLTNLANEGYERKPGGSLGNCTDSDSNDVDFHFISVSDPQNTTDPFTSGCIPLTPTRTFTYTWTPAPPASVVISEFRTRGTNGDEDEIIELYNPTSASIPIGGWQVWRSSGCGVVTSPLFAIPVNTWLPAGHHFLAASADASLTLTPDLVYTTQLYDNGGLALLDSSAHVVDQVGLCATTLYHEGSSLPPLVEDLDQGYERKPGGGGGSCLDTEDNLADFSFLPASQPQNLASAAVFCSGVTTSTPTLTPSRTLPPPQLPHMVISEFRSRGLGGADDEFVELYNATGAPVALGGWSVRYSSGCSTASASLVTITAGMVLLPGQHYLLLSNLHSTLVGSDQTFSPHLEDNGGLALVNASGTIIDQVGMCLTTAYREGMPLVPLNVDESRSYERRLGGATSCVDNQDNLGDFRVLEVPVPQNRASAAVVCAGLVTATPTTTTTRTRTPTRTNTRIPTAYPGSVVLNEYLPHPARDWDGSGEADNRDEYIEIINLDDGPINLKNWKLDDLAGGGSNPYTLPDVTLGPRQILRFFASETGLYLSDGGDSVRLLRPDGSTADSHFYSIVTIFDRAWCRLPDGTGAWAFACRPTPGRPNAIAGSEPAPGSDESPELVDPCPLADTLPPAFRLGECSDFGAGLPGWRIANESWLPDLWKFRLFVK